MFLVTKWLSNTKKEGSVIGSLLFGTQFFYSNLQMYIQFRFMDMVWFFPENKW